MKRLHYENAGLKQTVEKLIQVVEQLKVSSLGFAKTISNDDG